MNRHHVILLLSIGLAVPACASDPDPLQRESSDVVASGTERSNDRSVAKLVEPEAGVDVPIPAAFDGKKILLVGDGRIVVAGSAELVEPEAPARIFAIEEAVAGVDFPTDTPEQDHLVVVTRTEARFPLDDATAE